MRVENSIQFYSNQDPPAARLEQAFLEEMMNYIFPDKSSEMFGGGIGEGQFSSFLRQEYATMLARHVDLGLKGGFDG